MAITPITQVISDFPAPPDSAVDTPSVFNIKANAFVAHQAGIYTGEVNTLSPQMNALASEVNDIVATLPEGAILDTSVALDTTFSSVKIENKVPPPDLPTEDGLALVARSGGNKWEKILGLPDETNNAHKTVTNTGTEGSGFWSPIITCPNVISEDFTLADGANGILVSPIIDSGVTITVPAESKLVIL